MSVGGEAKLCDGELVHFNRWVMCVCVCFNSLMYVKDVFKSHRARTTDLYC